MKKLVLFLSLTAIVIAGLSYITCAKNGKESISNENVSIQCSEYGAIEFDKILGEDDDPLPIRGKVKNNSGGNLQDVHVELYTPELNFVDDDYTDVNGDYQIPEIVPDTYKLYFNKEGYQQLIKNIIVVGGTSYFDVGIDVLQEE